MIQFKPKHVLISTVVFFLLTAYSGAAQISTPSDSSSEGEAEPLIVYKNASCECCKKWITHLNTEGLATDTSSSSSLKAVKEIYQIPVNLRSCHTAISAQGFFFEGHIPARYIQQFLAHPPKDGVGLAVPGMPVGSPGMEVDGKFVPYPIVLLNRDGSTRVYAFIEDAAQQFLQSEQPEKPL